MIFLYLILFLSIFGIFMIWLGIQVLKGYREHFFERPKIVMSWDVFIHALGTGTSLGKIGVTLLFIGIYFCGMAIYIGIDYLFIFHGNKITAMINSIRAFYFGS